MAPGTTTSPKDITIFRGVSAEAGPASGGGLLLEDGVFFLLLEDGSFLLLEE